MKHALIISMLLWSCQSYAQSKAEYLESNRFDLTSTNFEFPQNEFKIIGFGAYHGSAKTEEAEYALLESLTEQGSIKYYLPETDFSIGYYFNQYLKTGDTLLLKDLVLYYGIKVQQERTIETYRKWQKIKEMNDQLPEDKKLTVVGIDNIVNYKYSARHLLEVMDAEANREETLRAIAEMVETDTTDFSCFYDSYSKSVLRNFVTDYEQRPAKFDGDIKDQYAFDHIVNNIKRSFGNSLNREKVIFDNYRYLDSLYAFGENASFVRFGFGHLEKEREGGGPSFFTMLIENNIYERDEVLAIIGYLTKSQVLWDILYDENGDYKSFTTDGESGIGDYEDEYFRGIDNLKKSKVSDITLFRLNKEDTPYSDGTPDLIEVVTTDKESEWNNSEQVKGKSTTDFLDYAVLISNSEANTPIEDLE